MAKMAKRTVSKVAKLEQDLTDVRALLAKRGERVEFLQNELDSLNAEADKVGRENGELKQANDELTDKVANLQDKLSDAREDADYQRGRDDAAEESLKAVIKGNTDLLESIVQRALNSTESLARVFLETMGRRC